jgi:hypothetical protein
MDEETQNRDENETILTDAELAAIDEAEPYEAGLGLSLEEARELARKRTQAWLRVRPEDLAA